MSSIETEKQLSHCGSTTEDMHHYMTPLHWKEPSTLIIHYTTPLLWEEPSTLIIHSGTNDLASEELMITNDKLLDLKERIEITVLQ